jgi:hypothetical protein
MCRQPVRAVSVVALAERSDHVNRAIVDIAESLAFPEWKRFDPAARLLCLRGRNVGKPPVELGRSKARIGAGNERPMVTRRVRWRVNAQ